MKKLEMWVYLTVIMLKIYISIIMIAKHRSYIGNSILTICEQFLYYKLDMGDPGEGIEKGELLAAAANISLSSDIGRPKFASVRWNPTSVQIVCVENWKHVVAWIINSVNAFEAVVFILYIHWPCKYCLYFWFCPFGSFKYLSRVFVNVSV